MKRPFMTVTIPVCLTIIAAVGYFGLAGDLNPPPGPVAPTMKTLTEVEPRIAINATNTPGDADSVFRIAQPGSYYLPGSLTGVAGKHGIEIAASGVTLDLNGFELLGVAGSFHGVSARGPNLSNIAVHNGSVRSWGGDGVDLRSSQPLNSTVIDVRASDNAFSGVSAYKGCTITGCMAYSNTEDGFNILDGCTITECTAYGNAYGIETGSGCTITECTAFNNTHGIATGSGCTIMACTASANLGNGISTLGSGCTITGCTAYINTGDGISTIAGSTISNCGVYLNESDGISASSGCLVLENTCTSNGRNAGVGAGIHANAGDNRIEGNFCTGADRGIDVDAPGNHILNNTVQSNTDNYDIVAGNYLNLIISELPESIDWPATVTLAGDLTGGTGQNGLTINADGVTIDLAGHGLIGVGGSGAGISVPAARKNLTVKNGRVASWGAAGISAANADSSLFTDLLASSNGGGGILAGEGCTLRDISSSSNTGDGIAVGTGTVIEHVVALANSANGISSSGASTIRACTTRSSGASGINCGAGSLIESCSSNANAADGIVVNNDSVIRGNVCDSNGLDPGDGAGIHITGADNRIEGNNCTDADRGIDVDGTGNIIVRNTCSGNTTNWDIVAGNAVAPIVQAATNAAAISGNTYAGNLGSTDPNANFTY